VQTRAHLPFGTAALLAAVLLAGCGKGSFQREVEVRFAPAPGSTRPDPAQVLAVRTACPGTPTVVLQPAPTDRRLSVAVTPIHYDARKADDREVDAVVRCVQDLPGVRSVGLVRQDY
jgi:hypothetical protein